MAKSSNYRDLQYEIFSFFSENCFLMRQNILCVDLFSNTLIASSREHGFKNCIDYKRIAEV